MQKADAFILAAGFGTRLKPLTDSTPKPLIMCGGKPLISWNIDILIRAGFKRIIVNTFYLADLVDEYLKSSKYSNEIEFVIVKEPEILGTGGGIKNIKQFLEHDVLLTLNSDIVLEKEFDISEVLDSHLEDKSRIATMMLREDLLSQSYGEIGIDNNGYVNEFLTEKFSNTEVSSRLMYTGVQVLQSSVFKYMPCKTDIFSITKEVYPSMLSSDEKVGSYIFNGYWNDAGTHERLSQASSYLEKNNVKV